MILSLVSSGFPNLFQLGYGRGQSIGLSLLNSQGRIPYDHRVDAQRKGYRCTWPSRIEHLRQLSHRVNSLAINIASLETS